MGIFGKKRREVTITDIQNEVDMEIENLNKTVTEIINTQITHSMMSVVNENAQSISVGTGGSNLFMGGNIVVSGRNSVFSVDQSVDVKTTNQAVVNVTQDASAMANLASKINADVMNKVQNDATLTQALQEASDLSKEKERAGGLADMLNTVTVAMENVLTPGSSVDNTSKTLIMNRLKNSLKNTNISENKIASIVESYVQNSISQKSAASCNISSVSNNTAIIGDVDITAGGKASISQVANVNALNNCILGAVQTTNLVNDIISNNETTSTNEAENSATAGQSLEANTKIKERDISKDSIADGFKSVFASFTSLGLIGLIIPVVFCLLCLLLVFFLMMPKGGSNKNSNNDSDSKNSDDNTEE